MITIERYSTFGWEGAIRGMRNPLNSWNRNDSDFSGEDIVIGENDIKLLGNLSSAGSSDRKVLRMIHVQVDITAPLYWWKEADTYKVATVSNSCSTMHKIHSRDLVLDDFSHDNMDDECLSILNSTIEVINKNRKMFVKTKDKSYWWNMIQMLPTSYNQMRTWDLNYETLLSIYFQRRHHKLDEWKKVCEWIVSLPYMIDIIESVEKKKEV